MHRSHSNMLVILLGPGLFILAGMMLFASVVSGAVANAIPSKTAAPPAAGNTSTFAGSNPDTCSPQWQVVNNPHPAAWSGSSIAGVAAISSNDVWAVGTYGETGQNDNTLTEHWNGTAWAIVTSPNPTTNGDSLYAVAGTSSSDVWAVGSYVGTGFNQQALTLVEHWNGTAWSVVPSPNPGPSFNYLNGIAAISGSDVWAVGEYGVAGSDNDQTLTEHWNGTAWAIVPSPSPSPTTWVSGLFSVAAVSSSDVWAVGFYAVGDSPSYTLTEHWNGTAWAIVSSPSPSTDTNKLWSVTAVSSSDVWAVGYTANGPNYQMLIEHWNGIAWATVTGQNPSTGFNQLHGITAISSSDMWAVGIFHDDGNGTYQTLTEHWNGTAWSFVPSPEFTDGSGTLVGVAAVSSSDVWAVGQYDGGPNLTDHYSPGSCTTPTPGGLPTSTPTVGPPTVTPTACTGFSDVPLGSTYYPFVTCLVGRHIINGYPDCTFRPSNNVTRAQLAKIVSLAADFSDPPGSQLFEDVPPGSTFFTFIQQLASRGFISGYPCGGPGEPCGQGNRPYFRPNNNATRGQIAKIVVNTAVSVRGWTLANPAGNTFQDVLPGTTYYRYVETAYAHEVIGGYACGSAPARPCIPPANKPYFVPNNNATRGQTSKIVANTFFPNCSAFSQR